MFIRNIKKIKPTTKNARGIVTRAYVVNGGNKNERKEKLFQLARDDQFPMYDFYKNENENAIVFATKHKDFDDMTIEKAKYLAGNSKLGENFRINTFGDEARFGVISISNQEESQTSKNTNHTFFSQPTAKKQIAMVTLKNGGEVPNKMVVVIMMLLEHLINKNPIAFYEFVEKCRNPKHEMFGNTEEIVSELGLLNTGRVHEFTKDIVLSAVEGDDLDMRLTSPIEDSYVSKLRKE